MSAPIEKPVAFRSGPARLSGVMGIPLALDPGGRGVVLVHGWGGYRIGPHGLLVETARILNDAGLPTLRFDLRGRGDSEGKPPNTSLDDMIWDTVAAVDFLQAEASVADPVLLGICSGANVAIGAAAFRSQVRTLLLWSTLPFQPEQRMRQRIHRMRHYLREYALKAFHPRTWARLFRGQVSLRGVGRTVVGEKKPTLEGRNLKDSERDVMADFARFRGRALFVCGSQDPEGLEGHHLFTHFCRRKHLAASFHIVRGATHSYYESEHSQQVIGLSMDFLGLRMDRDSMETA
jgi:pimeloyl-ACP methyl ester carboxylesterase